MNTINAAIIGLGVGEQHLITLKNNKHIKNIKIFDKNLKKSKSLSIKYGVNFCNKIDEIYNDSSTKIVSIASYDNYHFEQILKCLKNDKHVFVEKPAVINDKEAKKIFNLLKKKKKNFFSSNYILRKSERFIDVKKKIERNYLGKIYYIEADYNYGRLNKIINGWRGEIPYYSVNLGGGIHIIDLAKFLTSKKIIEVKSYANKIVSKNSKFKFNDLIISIVKFEGGLLGKFTSNFGCVYPHFHKLNIYGTKKTYENFRENGKFFIKRDNNKIILHKKNYKPKNKGLILDEFIDSIQKSKNRQRLINEVFDPLSVCFAIEKSYKTNKAVKVKYLK